jgi:photosystem II stability/assembly factor-like uncharacterized protein
LFCNAFFLQVSFSQGTWSKVDVPTDHFLRSVHFTDSLCGWAAGNGGVILHTDDGGVSWEVQASQTTYDIADIVFLNRNYGWASAQNYVDPPYGTVLLKTSDGGDTWSPEPYAQSDIFINCILFLDSLNVWMGGSPHALVKSEDGGQSWEQAAIDTSILAFFPVLSIKFFDENYGYACGGMFEIAGVIWRTWDGGETWYAIGPEFAPADEVHELHLYDPITVMGSGGDPDFGYGVAFIRSWDGGLNWEYEEIGLPGNSYDLDFVTEAEAWAPLGARQQMICSLDSGKTWEAFATPGGTAIYDIVFPDILHGWAVGDNGAVLKYKAPLGVSADPVEPEKAPIQVQCYPNPTNGLTIIKFQIPNSKFQKKSKSQIPNYPVSLRVYNAIGSMITVIEEKALQGGEYQFEFDAAGLPPGVYYCKLLIDGSGSTVRLIILP